MTPIAPVPEPATVLSWAVLVGLGALRLRRASRS
jgi:hypothetical protein